MAQVFRVLTDHVTRKMLPDKLYDSCLRRMLLAERPLRPEAERANHTDYSSRSAVEGISFGLRSG